MTPLQLAKAQCANYEPDGSCLKIEPSSLSDYRLSLPAWLPERRWRGLVREARARRLDTITLDRRTGAWMDRKQQHANRYRLDVHYCPHCGTRVGVQGEACLACRGVALTHRVDSRCRIGRGKRCGYFERCVLPAADDPTPFDPALQKRRAEARDAYHYLHRQPAPTRGGGTCVDCGGHRPKGKRYCDSCRRKRQRERAKGYMRRRRRKAV